MVTVRGLLWPWILLGNKRMTRYISDPMSRGLDQSIRLLLGLQDKPILRTIDRGSRHDTSLLSITFQLSLTESRKPL